LPILSIHNELDAQPADPVPAANPHRVDYAESLSSAKHHTRQSRISRHFVVRPLRNRGLRRINAQHPHSPANIVAGVDSVTVDHTQHLRAVATTGSATADTGSLNPAHTRPTAPNTATHTRDITAPTAAFAGAAPAGLDANWES